MPRLTPSSPLTSGLAKLQAERERILAAEEHSINPARRREFVDCEPPGELANEFVAPPFSVLDGRSGWWLERKRRWLSLSIVGSAGREIGTGRSHRGDNAAYLAGGKYTGGERYEKPRKLRSHNIEEWDEQARGDGAFSRADRNAEFRYADTANADLDEKTRRALSAYAAPGGVVHRYAHETESVTGVSTFDPVLCELVCRWFCPYRGHVLDPWAGGTTLGCVASYLGYQFTGIEVRPEQVDANKRQAANIEGLEPPPQWILGDSREVLPTDEHRGQYDLLFTDPPYFNLEVYSGDSKDGSTHREYKYFLLWYQNVLAAAIDALRPNRFAVLKIGEVRNASGVYCNFVGDSISTMRALGLHYYNEIVLLTPIGSLPVRTGAQFRGNRKVGKAHQNVLVFWKGNPQAIEGLCRPIRLEAVPASIASPAPKRRPKPIRTR